jgi:hypothetical protein
VHTKRTRTLGIAVLLTVIAIGASDAFAQSAAPVSPVAPLPPMQEVMQFDLFGGYSHQTLNSASGGGPNVNGWAADIHSILSRSFGLVMSASGVSGSQLGADLQLYSILIGPRLTFRTQRGNVFVHALVGGAQLRASSAGVEAHSAGVATAMGGGVDVKLTRRTSLRVAQMDYLLTEIAAKTQHNLRLSTGLVYRPGSAK